MCSKVVSFVLPLPPREASSNHHAATRGSRMRQAATIKAYRETCALRIRDAKPKDGWPKGPIALQYFWFLGRPTLEDGRTLKDQLYRPKDRSNAEAAAKAIQDAMQDGGLLPFGDSAAHVRTLGHDLYGTARLHGGQMQVVVVAMTDPEAIDESGAAAKAGGM